MTAQSVPSRYARLSILMHWLMLALFVGVYACIELKGLMPKGSTARGLFLGLHSLFGISIFALVWIRLVARLQPRPPILPAPSAWQTGLSHLMHMVLYVLMIATPLLAWLMLSAAGKPVPYFEFFLPAAPVTVDPDQARFFKHWHEQLGSAGYWLIGLHAVAGLFHHYWVGDNTLKRMMPGARR